MKKFIFSVVIVSFLFPLFSSELFAAELNCYIMLTEATADNNILPWGTKKAKSSDGSFTNFKYPIEKETLSQANNEYCSLSKVQPRSGVSPEYIDDKETIRITYFLGIEDAKNQEGIKVDDGRKFSGSTAFDHCLITYDYMLYEETLKYMDLTGVSYKEQMDRLVSAVVSNIRFKDFCMIAGSSNFKTLNKSRDSGGDVLTTRKTITGAVAIGGLTVGLFYLMKYRVKLFSRRRKK